MKNKKTLLAGIAGIALFFCLSSFQQTHEKYLTVRTIESISDKGYASKIIIANENGELEEIALGKMSDNNFSENVKKINAVLNKLADMLTSTYTFEKK